MKKEIKLRLSKTLNKEEPFSYKPFLSFLLKQLKFPFKLYGTLPMKLIYQDSKEIDFNLGPIHTTEQDLKKIMNIMQSLNQKNTCHPTLKGWVCDRHVFLGLQKSKISESSQKQSF